VAKSPTVEASTKDYILVAAITYEALKGIFCKSTPDNNEDAYWPNFGDERPPEEPA
jgi:hypothetical protein